MIYWVKKEKGALQPLILITFHIFQGEKIHVCLNAIFAGHPKMDLKIFLNLSLLDKNNNCQVKTKKKQLSNTLELILLHQKETYRGFREPESSYL